MTRIFNNENYPYFVTKEGKIYNENGKELKYSTDKDGYYIITLEKPIKTTYRVSRIVLRTFNDSPNNHFLNVRYRDGNIHNVAFENLYWEDVNVPKIDGEEWRKIVIDNKETYYSISNKGRCRNDSKGTMLAGKFNKYTGYVSYTLHYNSRPKYVSAHRLVMKAFVPCEYMDVLVINHIDGDKTNNCLENLEWCTNAENIRHAFDNNLIQTKYRNKDIWIYDLQGNFIKKSVLNVFSEEENINYKKFIYCLRGDSKSVDGKYQVFLEDKGMKIDPWYRRTTAKKVFLYTIEGEFIESFESGKELAEFLGISPSYMSTCKKNNIPILNKYIASDEKIDQQ